LSKENEPKEKTACPLGLRLPCAARNNRALRNSLRSDSPRAWSVIYPLLGCVIWLKPRVSFP